MKRNFIADNVQKMEGYVPGEQPKVKGLIKLNTNENPYSPSEAVRRIISCFDPSCLRLYPDPVATVLREKIAKLHGCALENVFAGNGSDEVLALCTRAFVEKKGTIGYFVPSYSLYPVLADIRGSAHKPVSLTEDFEWPAGEPEFDCNLFFLTCPNAPTGMVYARDKVERLCASLAGVVVIDEAYADFADSNFTDMAWRHDNVIVCRTFSKSYSLAGLRFGYALGHKNLIDALYKIKDSYNLDRLTQEIAVAAIEDQEHMLKNVALVRATRKRLANELVKKNFKVYPSQTNFLWVRPLSNSAEETYRRLRKKNILVRYFPGTVTGDFLRVTIGTDKEIDTLLNALD